MLLTAQKLPIVEDPRFVRGRNLGAQMQISALVIGAVADDPQSKVNNITMRGRVAGNRTSIGSPSVPWPTDVQWAPLWVPETNSGFRPPKPAREVSELWKELSSKVLNLRLVFLIYDRPCNPRRADGHKSILLGSVSSPEILLTSWCLHSPKKMLVRLEGLRALSTRTLDNLRANQSVITAQFTPKGRQSANLIP